MHIWFWVIFNAVILALLFLDLAVWNREGRVIPFKQALVSSICWILLAGAFAFFIHVRMSPAKSLRKCSSFFSQLGQ